jgi:hypothetical protein
MCMFLRFILFIFWAEYYFYYWYFSFKIINNGFLSFSNRIYELFHFISCFLLSEHNNVFWSMIFIMKISETRISFSWTRIFLNSLKFSSLKIFHLFKFEYRYVILSISSHKNFIASNINVVYICIYLFFPSLFFEFFIDFFFLFK